MAEASSGYALGEVRREDGRVETGQFHISCANFLVEQPIANEECGEYKPRSPIYARLLQGEVFQSICNRPSMQPGELALKAEDKIQIINRVEGNIWAEGVCK